MIIIIIISIIIIIIIIMLCFITTKALRLFFIFKTFLFLLLAGQIRKFDIPVLHHLIEGSNTTSGRKVQENRI